MCRLFICTNIKIFVFMLIAYCSHYIVHTNADSLYTVSSIAVDQIAPSSVDARGKALANGKIRGFKILLEKLVLQEDLKELKTLEKDTYSRFVDSYVINKESISSTRYRAILTVYVNKQGVRKFLHERKMRFAEAISKPLLILPANNTSNKITLWQ